MRAALVTIALLLIPAAIWLGATHAAGSYDRQVKQLWADEEALIRAKESAPRVNPPRPSQPHAPTKPGQRDA